MNLQETINNGLSSPTYFIADIAANHDGDLDRALSLIRLAADAGANAAKFQNFRAETIVSPKGFEEIGKLTHQSTWKKSVFEVYKDAALPLSWTDALVAECKNAGIEYFTAPYDLEYIEYFSTKMDYFKVGSGDITWKESLEKMGAIRKPILLATGASSIEDVENAITLLAKNDIEIVLMQCNTNYTGSLDNYKYLNLAVLNEYSQKYPHLVLGLSDHSPGHLAVLGAVALGARVIEKHFTDDCERQGPDHAFSLDPESWKKMVDETRILEKCLGDGNKKVEDNEREAQIVQRRALRFTNELPGGHVVTKEDLIALRPCPTDGINPFMLEQVVGKVLTRDVDQDSLVTWDKLK